MALVRMFKKNGISVSSRGGGLLALGSLKKSNKCTNMVNFNG